MFSQNKLYKIIVSFFIILFLVFNYSYANNVDSRIKKVFDRFIYKLEKKYDKNKEISYLEKINSKIDSYLSKKKISAQKRKILEDIVILSNEEIFKLRTSDSINTKQKYLEIAIRGNLKRELSKIKVDSHISKIGKKIYKISSKQEFVEDNQIKRVKFSRYYNIDENNYKYFKNKNGIIILNDTGNSWFVEKFEIEDKHAYSQSLKYFKGYITYKKRYFKEANNFYSYNFSKYTFFDDKYGFYDSDLKGNNINKNNSLLYLSENNHYNFVTKYKKVKLINSDIIFGVTDKDIFLKHLVNDKLYLSDDTDYLFEKLKKEIELLTNNKSKEEKIKLIYDFVLRKVKYVENLDLNDKKIFSGILTYKNGSGVCEGYVKLMSYALKFAGVPNADVIRGDVIDAIDFPKIGHAWLRIGNLYYDPTFDDPIGAKKDKEFSEYMYFALPKDLLYANRFDYGDTPDFLKTKSLAYRINYVNLKLYKLADKYKGKDYKILEGVKFLRKYNLKPGKTLTINDIKNIFPYYEVEEKSNGELIVYVNGKRKNIIKLQYFDIHNENVEKILKQINYNINGYYLFKWNKNGKITYKLAFNVKFK